MALQTEPQWKAHFVSLGITDDATSTRYAQSFVTGSITETTLPHLDKETLTELGVTVIGHRLTILNHIKTLSNNTPTSSTKATINAKLTSITHDMTQSQFRQFENDWRVYKQLINLQPDKLVLHLYNACEDSVRNTITNAHPDFLSKTEDQALETIKSIVTHKVNPAVHRKAFTSIIQNDQETIQTFLVRLRSAAVECSYSCPSCHYDLSETNIKDQFIAGLVNCVLQTEILAKANQLTTLDSVITHAEAFETAQRDQQHLQGDQNSTTVYSVHGRQGYDERPVHNRNNNRRNRNRNQNNRNDNQNHRDAHNEDDSLHNDRQHHVKPCSGCGSTEHGAPGSNDRSTKCQAWGKDCTCCGKPNHFASVCKSRSEAVRSFSLVSLIRSTADSEDDSVYDVSSTDTNNELISADIRVGHVNARSRPTKTMDIFPDSGAGICLGGTQHLEQLGHTVQELIPSNKQIRVVGGRTLPCLGWIMADFTIDGQFHTRQALYIAEGVQRLFFSKAACIATNILSRWYPHPMPQQPQSTDNTTAVESISHISERTPNDGDRRSPPARPAKMPYPATEKYIPALKQYLLRKFKDSAFDTDPPFPMLNAKPGHIFLKPDAIPHASHSFIPVPHHWKDEVKARLDDHVARGIIAPVPVGTPVNWCSQMIVARKKDGRPRIVVDFQHLNRQTLRESHPSDSPFNLASRIKPNTKKTVIDAVDGYHAVQLDEESQLLTTFITEWGLYMYRRMPQGFRGAGDAYVSRYDDIIKDVPNKVKIVDDACLFSDSIEQSFWDTWDYLTLCAENGIVASEEKFQFCQEEVDFAGLRVTDNGILPSESILSSIANFPVPHNLERARAWFGLVNQVAWAYSISPVMEPFRELIKPHNNFHWTPQLNKLFEASKLEIVAKVKDGVQSFEPQRRTCLQTDWCKHGIGYLLLQKHCSCPHPSLVTCCSDGWKLVYGGSRFTTSAESRYSPTEGEALGVSWALRHSRMFTLGCDNLFVSVDHKPLLGILNDHRELRDIDNPRIQRLKESTFGWKFGISHNPGKWHRGPDAMSRNPVEEAHYFSDETNNFFLETIISNPTDYDSQLLETLEEHVMAVTVASFHSHSLSSTDCVVTLADVRDAGKSDPNYKALLNLIESGFPSTRSSTDPALREFWEVRHRLSSQDGVAFMGTRTIIPSQLRKLTLERLHGAHQGVSSMKRRANTSVYWPGLSSAIVNRRKNCMGCEENGPSQPAEPLIPTKSPEWPFQMICMDYFTLESYSYLVTVDRFSGWPCVYHMKNGDANSTVLIKICRELFTTYGVPDEISSDGGPQFKAHEFSNFLETWGIHHRKSSAEYPQSNGRAEVGVKTMKRIIRDNTSSNGDLNNDKVLAAILQYKNTPLPDVDLSPAQILFHRNLKDSIPSHPAHYHLHRDWVVSAEQREAQFARRNKVVATRYNAHTRLLRELSVGTHVLIQSRNKKWNRLGVIVEKLDNRQYNIKVKGSGRVTLRNRRFIKPCSYVQPHQNQIITPPKQHQQLIPTVIDTRVDSPSQHVTPAQVMQPPPHPVDLPVDRGEVENNTTTTDNNDVTSSESNILTNGGGEYIIPQKRSLALRKLMTFNKPGRREAPANETRR